MIPRKTLLQLFTSSLCIATLTLNTRCILSYIVGSRLCFFTLATVTKPLIAALAGLPTLLLYSILHYITHAPYPLALSGRTLAFYVPGIFAGLYWRNNHWLIRYAVSLCCIIAFLLHPQGNGAAPYCLFWIIPILAAQATQHNSLLLALGSSFTAHAVGSVIWIYATGMSSAQWLALIPLVLVERCFIALILSTVYELATNSYRLLRLGFMKKRPAVALLPRVEADLHIRKIHFT